MDPLTGRIDDMAQQFEISSEDSKKAKVPHDLLLINLIFNHILVFVACLTTSVLLDYILIVPIVSALLLITVFIGARRAQSRSSWYVSGHWQLCAKRSLIFLAMLMVLSCVLLLIYWVSGGNPGPQHWAFGGAAALPVMVTVLALIVMESESLNDAKKGILPNWVKQKYPLNSLEPVEDVQPSIHNEEVIKA